VQLQVAGSDAAGAMALFDDVAHGDVEQGSIYELSEANLIKVGPQMFGTHGCEVCSVFCRGFVRWC
jgi:hypothetical protein